MAQQIIVNQPVDRLRVEFHSHTEASKDSLTSPEALLVAGRKRGLDRIVVTDHNNISGALRAKTLDPEFVIVGEEIMTQQGELLVSFLQEELPPGLDCMEAISELRRQGAFISVSHPFDVFRSGHWEISDLERIAPLVDAIETFNARCMRSVFNQQALEFARRHNLPGTAGSDAHAAFEVGKASLILPPFHDAESLKAVIRQGQPKTALSAPWVHFTSRYASWRKKLNKA
jgi:predicted metal-dependent phosphoesterase TrpH